MAKNIKWCLMVQVVAWLVFSYFDWIDETAREGYPLLGVIFVWGGLPAIIIMYFVFRRKLYSTSQVKVKQIAQLSGIWFLLGLVLWVVMTMLTCQWNVWIVHQATDGWENFLNGIEYPIYGFFLCVIPLATVIVGEIIIAIIRRCRKHS